MSGIKSNSQLLFLGHQSILESEARPSKGLTSDPAFVQLRDYHQRNASTLSMADMFQNDATRFDKFKYVSSSSF